MHDPPGTAPASELIADALRERILEGGLPPGARLPDGALAKEFSVARHTLRAALQRLENENLLVYKMHKGTEVKILTVDDVHEIYRVRRALELAAIHNSSAASNDSLMALEVAVTDAEVAVESESWNRVGTASLKFHQAIVGLFGSGMMDDFFRGVLANLRLAFAVMDDEEQWQTPWIPRDREVYELLLSGEREKAKAMVHQYLDDSEQSVVDAVRANETRDRSALRHRAKLREQEQS